MALTYLPQPQPSGDVWVRVSDESGAIVNRYVLAPGAYADADTWVATDVSGEPDTVKQAAEGHWTDDVVSAFQQAHPWVEPPAPTPPDLAPWQFRAMLKISGKEDDLLAFFNALPEPQQTVAKAKLEYTLSYRRKNELVLAAQQALGLSDAELDALWAQAAALT